MSQLSWDASLELNRPLAAHHFLDDFPQRAPLDVLCDEVEPLVLVENADELEHVGVVEATHDLDLVRARQHVYFYHVCEWDRLISWFTELLHKDVVLLFVWPNPNYAAVLKAERRSKLLSSPKIIIVAEVV